MIKEGKKRVTVTLDQDINQHLESWIRVTGRTASDYINVALRKYFTEKGDTWGDEESTQEIIEELRRKR